MGKKKVAITGIHNSGKTMFFTSLLWQLQRGEKSDSKGNIKISHFRETRSSVRREKIKFPFRHYRDTMAHKKQWPQKTKDRQKFCCQFKLSREGSMSCVQQLLRPFSRQWQKLEILDFPGERIADAAIAAHGDFGQWSDYMFGYFDDNSGYKEAGSRLRRILEAKDLGADTAVRAYREALISFIRDCKPLISPSFFFLDRNGNALAPEKIESAAVDRPCGLDASSQFVPLPEAVRKTNPKIAKQMRKHFERYRKEVVQPLFNDLEKSNSLIVLIDIPSLLLGGVQRYNDNRQIIEDLCRAIGENKFRIFSSLKRIAFVATKADLVSHNDICKGTLKSLLEEMNEQAMGSLPDDMKIEWFECSACWSTKPGGPENTLQGVPIRDNPEKKKMEYPVTPLPDSWPPGWNPEDYQFPDVHPDIPSNVQIPPKHSGLDKVFNFAVLGRDGQS